MKIKNLIREGVTLCLKGGESITVPVGAVSDDHDFDTEHPVFAAQSHVGNIAIDGAPAAGTTEPRAAAE